jgi:hypothetical protein
VVQQADDSSTSRKGLSGPVVIVAIFGSVIVITFIAVAAFFLTKQPNLKCDAGDASTNPVDASGHVVPLTKTFTSIGDAESFICHRIAYPSELQGLKLETISATRDSGLGDVIEGIANAFVTLTYAGNGASLSLEVSPFPIDAPVGATKPESVEVQGQGAKLIEDAGKQTVWWGKDKLYFLATASGLDRQTLLAILDSVQ